MPDDPNAISISSSPDPKAAVRLRKMDPDAGWIGRVTGNAKNAPNNIAFVVVMLILVAGLIVTFAYPQDRLEFWKVILPIVTLTLGYLFGRGSAHG